MRFPNALDAASLVVGVPTAIGALVLVAATYVCTDLFNSVLAIVCFRISNRVLPSFLGVLHVPAIQNGALYLAP